MKKLVLILVLVLVASTAFAQASMPGREKMLEAEYELRSMIESILRPWYLNGHHKKAVKASNRGEWYKAVAEYEAAVREYGFSFRRSQDDSDTADVHQAQVAVLASPLLNSIRYELALCYANRAAELSDYGRTSEADSLLKLSLFFLENVHAYVRGGLVDGLSLVRLGSAFHNLGKLDRAIIYYRMALWNIEEEAPIWDPLRAAVNIRLGQAYLALDQIYEAEPPLLNGTESADSAVARCRKHGDAHHESATLATTGRVYLAEVYRRMDKQHEAESLYASALETAVASKEPMILSRCYPLFDNYSVLLRKMGRNAEADSVNYWTDLVRRRGERKIESLRDKNRK